MRRPCLDTPEQLWISSFPTRAASHLGNKKRGAERKGAFPWTPALEAHARRLRDTGMAWVEVARELQEMIGARTTGDGVKAHLQLIGEEGL
jgi:hypothetical protein